MSCQNVYEAISTNNIKVIDHFINEGSEINGILFYACMKNKIAIINYIVEEHKEKIDLDVIQSKISQTFIDCEKSFWHLKSLLTAERCRYQIVDVPELIQPNDIIKETSNGRSTGNIFEAIDNNNIFDIDFYMSQCENVDEILFYICTIDKKYLIDHIIRNFNPNIRSVYNKLIDSRWKLHCDESIEYLGDIILNQEIKNNTLNQFEVVDAQIDLDPSGNLLLGSNKRDHINMINKNTLKTYDNIISYAVHFEIPSLLIACYLSQIDDCLDVIKDLLKVGMNLNMNCAGLTALGLAIEGKNKKIIQLLIEKGADINVVDEYGNTILQQAYKNSDDEKYLDIVQLLLENGANISIKNNSGKTFFDLIREKY
ncbi:ankyrin repeat protein [Moumouvirus australiensis]|uniref:Ankyrin repeat protein n=1 Tax=Moumouvirus australiensis TaxID=2109587 RepID=A0A2P1EMS7_9VIRU|nr:ankyrin repeat protein [Moumouvirus australiensis]AVL95187.1 ankyrin repeat protein [Moumouvirus australiensis]